MMRRRRTTALAFSIILAALALCALLPAAGRAARYPLGYDWRTLRTGDVVVFYPEGYEQAARYTADRTLAHLDSLEQWYGIRPPVARVVLNPEMDLTRAMATVMPLRMELNLTPALDKGLRPQAGFYLDRVTAHELTHLMEFSTVAGITRPARWLFGDAVAPLGIGPDWIVEGQSIWSESRSGGGRLNSSYHAMLNRAPLLANEPWSLAQIGFDGRVAPHGSRAYVGGSYLYRDLIRRHGTSAAAEWMRWQAALPALHGLTFSLAFDENADAAWERTRDRTLAAFAREQARPAKRNLLHSPPRTQSRYPAWTRDGRIVFREESYDRPDRLLVVDPEGSGEPAALDNVGYASHRGLTLDGDRVITSRIRRDFLVEQKQVSTLYAVAPGGGQEAIMGPSGPLRGWSPALHEGSRTLAWIGRGENNAHALKTVRLTRDLRTASSPQILFDAGPGLLADPAWNSDGSLLAFVLDDGSGEYVVVRDFSEDRWLEVRIEEARATWDPAFGPGNRLWVSADPEGVFDLFTVDLEAGTARRRTQVLTGAMEPAPSPDGSSVAYAHYHAEGHRLALLHAGDWLSEPAGVRIDRAGRAPEVPRMVGMTQDPGAEPYGYSALWQATPRFWLPMWRMGDGGKGGARIFGRDPLGLLSWELTGLWVREASDLDATLSATLRTLPLDLRISGTRYPHDRPIYSVTTSSATGNDTLAVTGEAWKARAEGSMVLYQTLFMDGGAWWRHLTPSIGFVTRERHFQVLQYRFLPGGGYSLAGISDPRSFRYHGAIAGLSFRQYYGAARDPAPRHLIALDASYEHNLPGEASDLEADALMLQGRWHLPGPLGTVVAASGAWQRQEGAFGFSRNDVTPRGYAEEELPAAMLGSGHGLLAGLELHMPLLFPDGGLGMGWAWMERVRGLVFAEGATGWGEGRTLEQWVRNDRALSLGAELVIEGDLLYEIGLVIRGGVAWRPEEGDVVPYLGTSLPGVVPRIVGLERRR